MAVVTRVKTSNNMLAAVAVLLMMVAGAAAARPVLNLRDFFCPTADKYVYPYWSFCWNPAELSTGYVYGIAFELGSLAPEYDESNSTYYVRLSDEGAKYVAVGIDADTGTLLVNSPVYIFNSETKRALKWRQEGVDEYFLIEEEVSSVTDGAQFFFQQAFLPHLACPPIFPPPQCQAYYLVSYPGSAPSSSIVILRSGLLSYPEEGATYIKAAVPGSNGDLPLLVTTIATSTNSDILPLPKIRTVTDHHGA